MARTWRRPRERGQAIVEIAIVLPFLAALVLGGLDVGRAYYYTTALTGAAREGVRVAYNPYASTSQIQQAAISAAPELGLGTGNIQMTTTCSGCYGSGTPATDPQVPPTVTVTVTWNYTPVTPFIGNFFSGGSATLVGVAEGPVS